MNLNYTFKDQSLQQQAVTHPSSCKDDRLMSYERLEFLGDSVLSLVISECIYRQFPQAPEGALSVLHSHLVSKARLAEVARAIALGDDLILDAGEESNGGRNNDGNLENAMEALLGAIYLDAGFAEAKRVITELWSDLLAQADVNMQKDAKSRLQEWAQKQGKPIPQYQVIEQVGDAHSPTFTVQVSVEGVEPQQAQGKSKKAAEAAAAEELLKGI